MAVEVVVVVVVVIHTEDLGQIIYGLHTVAGKIGGCIDVQTSIVFSQLTFNRRETKNHLQHIVEFSASLLDSWDGVDGKVTTRRWDSRRSRHGWQDNFELELEVVHALSVV